MLIVATHVLLGCYGVIREVYAGEVKVGSCHQSLFHINEFLSLWRDAPSKSSANATKWGPA